MKTKKYSRITLVLAIMLCICKLWGQKPCPGTMVVTDVDGNVYNTVQIGNQCWMKENLRTTHFADGYALEKKYRDYLGDYEVTNNGVWYSHNDHRATYEYAYGEEGVRINNLSGQGICPNGWHVPSFDEWVQLTDYISNQEEYHCKNRLELAEAMSVKPSGNNATGFSALPNQSSWWCANDNSHRFYYFYLQGPYTYFNKHTVETYYYSPPYEYHYVRCVRDISISDWVSTPEEEAKNAALTTDNKIITNDIQGKWRQDVKRASRNYLRLKISSNYIKVKRATRTVYDGKFVIDRGRISAGSYTFELIKNTSGKFQPIGFEKYYGTDGKIAWYVTKRILPVVCVPIGIIAIVFLLEEL